MATTRLTVKQDRENVVHQDGIASIGMSRIPPKPFIQDNIQQATPRRALGDVRNLQTQRVAGPQKNILHSDKKNHAHGLQQSRSSLTTPGNFSSFLKPSGNAKKSNKKAIKVLEDDRVIKHVSKGFEDTDSHKGSTRANLFQKETAFPFMEKEPELELPNYLADLSKISFGEGTWWPSFANPLRETMLPRNNEVDMPKLELDDLPLHTDFSDSFLNELKTDILEICSKESSTTSSQYLELGPIEHDLNLIDDHDSLFQFGNLLKELESIEVRCNGAKKQ